MMIRFPTVIIQKFGQPQSYNHGKKWGEKCFQKKRSLWVQIRGDNFFRDDFFFENTEQNLQICV